MKIYIIIILISIYSAIISILNSIYIKNIDIMNLLFIQYSTSLFSSILIYLFLSKKQINLLFTKEYYNVWIINIIISFLAYIVWYYYYISVNHYGPGKTHLIFSISKIIALFTISIFILSNSKINLHIIIGIILSLLGIYILESKTNYI